MNKALHAFADAPVAANLLKHWYALLEHIPIGVFVCDADGTVTRYNERAAALWGIAPQPGRAHDCGVPHAYDSSGTRLTPEETPTGTVLRTGRPEHDREILIDRADGKRITLLTNAEPLFDDAGELIGVVTCIQDATAQKQAEARAAQGRYLLEAIIETTPECIKLVAADGTLLQMNAAGCEMLGASSADLVGRCVFDVVAPEDRARWRDHHDRICLGERLSWQFDIVETSGARRRMETHAAPLTLPDGSLAHLAVTRDITERIRQERELDERRNQLQELLEALPAAVYTTDAEGTITFYNQACVSMAGRTPRIGEDKWCVTWKLFKPDGTPLPHDQCPMAVALGENRAVRGEEAVAERPDGSRVPIIPYPTPIRDASGRLVGAINMLVDISERKQAEYRQRILLDELNHRVKNNLQMLHSLLRTAQRETENREAHAVLEDAAHRVGAIAAAQRVLYSAESTTRFDTGEFLQAVCQSAQQAFAGDVKIKVQANNGELSNEVSMPLALILNELLTNAVKHGLKGRRHGIIRVALTREAERYRLAVEDDGDGFELKPASRRSSGLGLVLGLTRQIGGTFTVERAAGARCVVSFPGHETSVH
jgi:PAS domain S-box-containing protein